MPVAAIPAIGIADHAPAPSKNVLALAVPVAVILLEVIVDHVPSPARNVVELSVPVALMPPTGTYDHEAVEPLVVMNLPALPDWPGSAAENAAVATKAVVAI